MKRSLGLVLACLALALLASVSLIFVRARRGGVHIRLDQAPAALPAPQAPVRQAPAAPRYTNEQLHNFLDRQSQELGIQDMGPQNKPAPEPDPAEGGFLGSRLGTPESRERSEAVIRQLAIMRRALEGRKKPVVPLEGTVAPLLSEPESGGRALDEASPRRSSESAPPESLIQAQAGSWSGLYGGDREGTLTITDAQEWARVWDGVSRSPAPAVDFSRQQIVGVFLGLRPSGGYRVEILPQTTASANAVLVRYRETAPAPGHAAPEGRTAPFALRAMPRSDLPVRFERVQ